MNDTLDAIGTALPNELACAACGDAIERGYVPVAADDGHDPDANAAVCDACGWRDVGYAGCAPELGDFDGGDLLVRVESGDDGLEPVSVTDER